MGQTESEYKVIIVLNLRKDVPGLMAQADAWAAAMAANQALFGTLTGQITAVTGASKDLHDANEAAATRAKGTVPTRNVKERTLRSALKQLGSGVQGLCDATPAQAMAIAKAAGMGTKKVAVRVKAALAITQGSLSGEVVATAKASRARKPFYGWRYSVDGGKTWIQAPTTNDAHTVITGLPPLTLVQFQVQITAKNVPGEWSPAVTFLVR